MRVLVVDDFWLTRKMVREVLTDDCGIDEVREAVDGVDAMEQLLSSSFDLAVVDIDMPRKDGLSLIAETRQLKGDQKFLVLSALSESVYVTRAFALGAVGFVAKGAEPEVLAAAIMKALEYSGKEATEV
jgi:DNA-binding NarL/FixJ family response regulator